ncbi:DUF7676 family protein [Candidatus Viridilinea mediisalina]|uniref:Uncharacterized protein n=1 Tax=Candidatus Viridilinea mediisalina TaxID=2024553 RepID=A0A2A6RFH3_9CHLR|nr:hypothetical protein [Candidatus Viridilinea mediisalina]PDW01600.1 hypothetical protein CJ255_18365 [Candidatus Viridilinea mediisalina]
MITTAAQISVEPGFGTLELFPLVPTETILYHLFTDLFHDHRNHFIFGPCVPITMLDLKEPDYPPEISLSNGYLTVDFGAWHFHLCIGEHKGTQHKPLAPELLRQRRTARAEFYRRITPNGGIDTWGLRCFNGKGGHQITILLPTPFVASDMERLEVPDWSRLALWDDLRFRYLGLTPDPRDRSVRGYRALAL